jgi:hypothetical protein
MKFCFLGDSHTGALWRGFGNMTADERNFEITAFAATFDKWGSPFDWSPSRYHIAQRNLPLSVSDGQISATTSDLKEAFIANAGKTEIDIDQYDAFVLVGLTFSIAYLNMLAYSYRYDGMKKALPRQILVSEDCFFASAKGILFQTTAIKVLKMLREASDKPIFIIPEPFPSRATPRDSVGKLGEYIFAEENGYSKGFVEIFARVSGEIQDMFNVQIMSQPGETIQDCIFTRHEFSRAVAENIGNNERIPEYALLHNNADWGKLVLHDLQRRAGIARTR